MAKNTAKAPSFLKGFEKWGQDVAIKASDRETASSYSPCSTRRQSKDNHDFQAVY